MRILLATLGFYPAVSWGGPVAVVYQHARALAQRGHTVQIVASNLLDKKRRIATGSVQRVVEGLDVHYLQTYVLARWPGTLGPSWLAPVAHRHLCELVEAADLIHVNGTRNAVSWQALRQAERAGKPLVLQPHGTLPQIVNTIWLKKTFDRLLLQPRFAGVDAFIALQHEERRQIIAAGGAPGRIHLVPNGICVDRSSLSALRGRFRARLEIPDKAPLILFLGRINRKKGADLLVEAFASWEPARRQQAFLVVAGPDDGQLDEVVRQVQRHRLQQNVLFPGLLEGDEVWAAHVDADLFVLPCRADTFPMAIVEACASGTPLVVTEGLEIASLLHDIAATVVPADAGALSGAMQRVLDDPRLRQRYAQGGRQLAESAFSISAAVDALEAVYRQAYRGRHAT